MAEVAIDLPTDQSGIAFVGPGLLVPSATEDPDDPTRAIAHVIHRALAGTVLASAARTTSTNSADQTNQGWRGAMLLLDVTATPNDAQTLTVQIQVKDPVSGKYVTVTAFTALVASALGATPTTATYVYTLYPAALETAAVANHEVQALALPRPWRARVAHSSSGSWTYSLGYAYLP